MPERITIRASTHTARRWREIAAGDPSGLFAAMVEAVPYKKHYLGVSDNVTWFCEQIDSIPADPFHYRVVFRPATIMPDIEIKTR